MNFDAEDFRLMNTSSGKDRIVYGDITAGLHADVRGTIQNPDINLDVSLENESQIFFVVPEAGTATIEREGVVVFIDKDKDSTSNILTREETADTAVNAEFSNISLDANINVDKNVQLTIVVDPASEEQIRIKGKRKFKLCHEKQWANESGRTI